ncbi:hypothetical protein AJ88_26760 [Mesorhizobium amorphae CCBAU 01583]|nr:hypothetical protein AJ88_26760 [Mesorhizobium amorphae CCBAU 01583]
MPRQARWRCRSPRGRKCRGDVEGVDDVSTSISEGSSVTTVEFTLGTDPETATNDVRNAVSEVQSSLPAAAQTPVVAKVNATGNSVLTYVVEAPSMSPDALSWYIDNDVAKALLGVDGVSKITRSGGVDRVIRVELDPDRLAALGISAGDVSQTLASNNVNQPGGRTAIGGQEQSVRTLASATSVEALADTRIALSGAGDVKLSDLGTVVDSWEKPRQAAYLDGRQVVAFNVYRSVGSSEIDVVKAARATIAEMGAKTTTAKFTEVTSSSGFVQESYDAALEALWMGALLAIGVVWLFLRDIRATLVSAIAMPLSLIPTFAVMAAFDISLSNITLLALSLVVGILVDDAIVEMRTSCAICARRRQRLPGGDRGGRRDRACRGGDHSDHRRRVPAGGLHARHSRKVLPELRHRRLRLGAVLAAGSAHAHTADGRLSGACRRP